MDVLDRRIIKALERNARITYRELSDQLGISAPAVQSRIVALESSGRIAQYRTLIHHLALGSSFLLVMGQTERTLSDDLVETLRSQGSVRRALFFGDTKMMVSFDLQDLSAMEDMVTFVQDTCHMDHPDVRLINNDPFDQEKRSGVKGIELLKNIDYRILRSLRDDARKPLSDISKDVGVATKTVKKRLSWMMENELIFFDLVTFPDPAEDLTFNLDVVLKPQASGSAVVDRALNHLGDYFDGLLISGTRPNLLMFDLMTQNVEELTSIVDQLRSMDEVEAVTPDLVSKMVFFETWRDRLIDDHEEITKRMAILE